MNVISGNLSNYSGSDDLPWISPGINSACPLFLHRADSQRTSNIPDAAILRKMVRNRSCHPVLRGVLESLLRYLTQDLPKWATQDGHLEKPWADQSDQRTESAEESKMIQDKPAERFLETLETYKLQNSCGGTTSRDPVPRHLTTFQLLQSKFMRSSSKAPLTCQREVGTLSSSRGATGDLKNTKEPEPKSQTRRGQGQKRGGSVKDIVARFAMAERKERGENTLMTQPLRAQLTGRGTVLSTLMERFETVATVRKGSAAAQIRLPSDVKQMVACRERRQQGSGDQNAHKHKQPRKMKIKPDLKGLSSDSGQQQAPGLKTPEIKSKQEVSHVKGSDQKPEDQCSIKTVKHQQCNKTDHHGEIQTRPEEDNITARLKYADLEVFSSISVIEECLPEPYNLLPQVEAPMKCHVGTITTSSPVWFTSAAHSPKLHPAEASGKPPTGASENGSRLNLQREGNGGAEDNLNPSKPGTGRKTGPTHLIPRVHRFTFPQDVKDHPRSSQRSTETSESICLNAGQPACLGTSNTGPLAHPPSNTETKMLHATIKETQMEDNPHNEEGKAKELTPVVTEDPNMQHSEEAKDKATSEEDAIPAVSSSEAHPKADYQKLRPKYKTVNYGDPSVKAAYKPKIIRFTDTFTF